MCLQKTIWQFVTCGLPYLQHLSPSSGKREKSDHDESSIEYWNLGCGFEQNCLVCGNRTAASIKSSQYSRQAKQAKLQNRLENADSPDLFEDILAGDKKDIASSHQLPRLHDDSGLEVIFHIYRLPFSKSTELEWTGNGPRLFKMLSVSLVE